MKKVLCCSASGPHVRLLNLARPSFEAYAARHRYDLVIETDQSRTPAASLDQRSGAFRSAKDSFRRKVSSLLVWGIHHMPISARISRRLGLGDRSRSLPGRLIDTIADRSLHALAATTGIADPPSWTKIAMLRSLLHQYDLVLWIDADALIVDPTVDIATELIPDKWLYMVEHSTHEGVHLNAGVMMIRSCEESRRFFASVEKRRQYMIHRWWEQAAMLYLLGYDIWPVERVRDTAYSTGLAVIGKEWNSIVLDPADRPCVLHYAGIPDDRRIQLMQEQTSR